MPLGSWFTGQWYGEAAAAMVTAGGASSVIAIKGQARVAVVNGGVASAPLLKPTRLRNSPVIASGSGALVLAVPKARARMAMVSRVNALSQDDVTGAVLEALVEPGVSLKHAMRLMLAAMAGKVSGAGGSTVTIRDVNDTANRLVATVDANGNRTVVTRNAG